MNVGTRTRVGLLLAAAALILATAPASAQQSKRLILKDGSYQLVSQYEIKGDRVRYLSAERNEWEEVPYSMIDWAATSKFEKDRAAGVPPPEAVELDREMAAERQAEEAKTPEVAPRLRLPGDGGVLLLDTFQGQPQLLEMHQNSSEVNRNRRSNMIRAMAIPIPVSSAKQTIELDGAHASLQAHATLPSIYISLNPSTDTSAGPARAEQPQQPEQPWDRFHIVRAQVKKDKRVIGVIRISPLGKSSQQQDLVPTTSQELTGNWVKVTPTAPLDPGEYAVVELLGHQGMNMFVWDFGVNPSAPANAGAPAPQASPPSRPN